MDTVILSAGTALVVSVICNKILAVRTFNTINGYVKDLIDMAKKSIQDARCNK